MYAPQKYVVLILTCKRRCFFHLTRACHSTQAAEDQLKSARHRRTKFHTCGARWLQGVALLFADRASALNWFIAARKLLRKSTGNRKAGLSAAIDFCEWLARGGEGMTTLSTARAPLQPAAVREMRAWLTELSQAGNPAGRACIDMWKSSHASGEALSAIRDASETWSARVAVYARALFAECQQGDKMSHMSNSECSSEQSMTQDTASESALEIQTCSLPRKRSDSISTDTSAVIPIRPVSLACQSAQPLDATRDPTPRRLDPAATSKPQVQPHGVRNALTTTVPSRSQIESSSDKKTCGRGKIQCPKCAVAIRFIRFNKANLCVDKASLVKHLLNFCESLCGQTSSFRQILDLLKAAKTTRRRKTRQSRRGAGRRAVALSMRDVQHADMAILKSLPGWYKGALDDLMTLKAVVRSVGEQIENNHVYLKSRGLLPTQPQGRGPATPVMTSLFDSSAAPLEHQNMTHEIKMTRVDDRHDVDISMASGGLVIPVPRYPGGSSAMRKRRRAEPPENSEPATQRACFRGLESRDRAAAEVLAALSWS